MKKEILSLSMFLCIISSQIVAQSISKSKIGDGLGLTDGPEVINQNIPGAPILSKPMLIMGENKPLIADGHGIAAPAYYDFDDDGLKDLLIGEFGTGLENGNFVGNFMRFYRNIGDNNNPKFTGISYYARPFDKVQNNGTPLSTKQFCCMGFTPQFIDLDSDGKMDIISGQYNGHVRWFRGIEGGFDDGELLDQEGDPLDVTDYSLRMADNVKSQHYWLFSIANFGDLDNDGLLDMIVGGSSIRISKNIGTKSAPKFSKRELLLDIKGDPLKIGDFLTPKEKEQILNYKDLPAGGTNLISPIVFDWDQDGILDILATNPYDQKEMPTVTFFKGVKTKEGHRFNQGISLFNGKNDAKVLPGRWLKISVADWNNDGVNDLLVGVMAVTLYDNVFNGYLSWNWEKETGVQKYDPGNMKDSPTTQNHWIQRYLDAESSMGKIPVEDFQTMRHLGYVYVMLGEKRKDN